MVVQRIPVEENYIDIALSAEKEFLKPGAEADAIEWVAEQSLQHCTVADPTIWKLESDQINLFRRDLALPTPERYDGQDTHSLTRYGILQLALATTIGTPFGVQGQRNGVVMQDVFPKENLLDRANSGLGARVPFEFHTDQAFGDDPAEQPDNVALGCIRNVEVARTGLVSLSQVIAYLNSQDQNCETTRELARPEYVFHRGRSDEGQGESTGAILTENGHGYHVRLGGDMTAKTSLGRSALSKLHRALERYVEDVVLEPGEILIFPNRTSVHRRSEFIPHPDPASRRWIQKIYIHATN